MTSYERYCKARDAVGLKDANVASLAKIGRSTFSDWKNGRSVPKQEKIEKIAAVLGVTPEYILGRSFADDRLFNLARETVERRQIEELLDDESIRQMVLFAGGIPKANRDIYIKAIIAALRATMK